MQIKECKSQDLIMKEIKQKLIEIIDKIKSDYKNDLIVYRKFPNWNTCYLAEITISQTKIFGKVIYEDKESKDILTVSLNGRELIINIIDPSEFIYPLAKEEFTKFAENNGNSIDTIIFTKDF